MELVNPILGGVATIVLALGTFIKIVGPEYRSHVDWRDKRAKRRHVREISTVSPATPAITKRSA